MVKWFSQIQITRVNITFSNVSSAMAELKILLALLKNLGSDLTSTGQFVLEQILHNNSPHRTAPVREEYSIISRHQGLRWEIFGHQSVR